MVLYQQLLTRNDCCTAGKTIVPEGVMVHSTGANNPRVSRYVPGDEVLGVNRYGNHWDQPGGQVRSRLRGENHRRKRGRCPDPALGPAGVARGDRDLRPQRQRHPHFL